VLIRSDACGVFAAAKGIMNIMGDYDVDPDVVLEVPLSRYKQHGAVVGKKGCVIAGLSANHNVRIYVPPNSKHDPEGKASNANVQLEGELENVEKWRCLQLFLVALLEILYRPLLFVHEEVNCNLSSRNTRMKR